MAEREKRKPQFYQARILIALLVFLGVNLIFYGLVTHPGKRILGERETTLELVRYDHAVSEKKLKVALEDMEKLEQIVENLKRFYFEVLTTRQEQMNRVRSGVSALSKNYNVNLTEINYEDQPYYDIGLVEYGIRFPLRGQFKELGQFIGQIEASENFLIINRLSLGASDETGRMLNLSFDLSTLWSTVDEIEPLWVRMPRQG